jgi:transcriptional regulator CtsR
MLYLMTEGIGSKLTEQQALQIIQRMVEQECISKRTGFLMKSAITDKAISIPSSLKDGIRASIMKSMITALIALEGKAV